MNEKTIGSAKVALEYLSRMGWSISRPSFYRAMQSGSLARPPWSAADLDAFAAVHCKPATTTAQPPEPESAPRESSRPPSLAAAVMEARKAKIEIESERAAFELERARGRYIEFERHTEEVCRKFQLVRQAAENWVLEFCPELIAACGGDQRRRWELVEVYQASFAKYLSRLDTPLEIQLDAEVEP